MSDRPDSMQGQLLPPAQTREAESHRQISGEVLFVARGSRRNALLMSGAGPALNNMKYEIAAELGLPVSQGSDYWGHVTTREAGSCGGEIVKRMVALAEETLSTNTIK